MRLRDPLPRPVSWITRLIGYTLGAFAIAAAWYVAGNILLAGHYSECLQAQGSSGSGQQTAMQGAKALIGCVAGRVGAVEWLAFRPTKKLMSALPSAPCAYAGTWRSRREGSVYRVVLGADGQFLAEPIETQDPGAVTATGSWGVVGKGDERVMVWLYDEGRIWPPDTNPIKNRRADGFTLVEENGSTTEFTRIGFGSCELVS